MARRQYRDVLTGQELTAPPAGKLLRFADSGAVSYLVGPALFDPQVNGFSGVDFQDPHLETDALEWAVAQIRQSGCAHILLTLITQSADFLEAQLARIGQSLDSSEFLRETIVGVHLEGPFLSDKEGYFGAHAREHLILPSWQVFERLQRAAAGRIRLITLAPELPGSMAFIERATASGVWIALGHTDATSEQLTAAVAAGARLMTHLGNGCPAYLPRHDNIIQRVLAVPELMATLIPDGFHVPQPALGNLARSLGPARLAMTTDSMSAAAAPPGDYRLGDLVIHMGEDRIVMHPNGRQFAGSSLRMVDGLFNAMRLAGLDAAGAWRAWTCLRERMFPALDPPMLLLPLDSEY
jgi:N-acetylglucosamine-6-phosphate deacetylase